MQSELHSEQENDVVSILKSGNIDSIYFNEFVIGVSKNDIFMLLRRNGKYEAVLNASHIAAKSFAIALNEAIANYEKETNQKIVIPEDSE
jgi:hypothetical protein